VGLRRYDGGAARLLRHSFEANAISKYPVLENQPLQILQRCGVRQVWNARVREDHCKTESSWEGRFEIAPAVLSQPEPVFLATAFGQGQVRSALD
jgi:hypothetical protein